MKKKKDGKMTITQKIRERHPVVETPHFKQIAEYTVFTVIGFLFGCGSVLGELHPFGISIVAVSKRKHFLFTAAGAAAGTLIYGLNAYTARYITALLIAALCAFGISALRLGGEPLAAVVSAFGAALITGLIIDVKLSENVSGYVLTLAESILCAGGTYFFYRVLHSDYRRLRFSALAYDETACVVISAALLLINLSDIKLYRFTPARIVAVCVMLTVLRFFGERRGIVFALCLGFVLSLNSSETLLITGVFAFSVMIASLFINVSHLAAGAAFLLCVSFFCISSQIGFAADLFADSAAGCLIFLLLPVKLTAKLEELGEVNSAAHNDGSLRQSLVLKLRFAGTAMAAISESVEQVSERIDEITRKENRKLKEEISEEEFASREIILEKTNQIRRVASDQFFSISGMLEDLAFEFDKFETFDSSASAKIRSLLSDYDIHPQSISVVEDKYSRIRVEILADSPTSRLEKPFFRKEIGKICNRYFDAPVITYCKDETMVSFNERPNFRLETGFAQHSADGHLCGDTVKILGDSNGHSILIISDGMGTGSRAALDGAMGAGLISKLINAGFGFDSALKVVNCALLVKSNDESLATLDIANVDLFTGKCEMLKSGAPASYIIKGKSINKCELFSMPAGILRGIEFARRTAVLSPGDTVILMSDGISDLGEGWIKRTIGSLSLLQPQEAADTIIKAALDSSGEKIDDMSVIVARLTRN